MLSKEYNLLPYSLKNRAGLSGKRLQTWRGSRTFRPRAKAIMPWSGKLRPRLKLIGLGTVKVLQFKA